MTALAVAPALPAPRVMLEDLSAPHQIILFYAGRGCSTHLAVSCTCLRIPRGGRSRHAPIEIRALFPAAEAVACWRAWHAERRIAV